MGFVRISQRTGYCCLHNQKNLLNMSTKQAVSLALGPMVRDKAFATENLHYE